MIRYADPHACPDCRTVIEAGDVSCRSCGLPLLGSAAQELFSTLQRADRLLVTLRGQGAPPSQGHDSAPRPAATPERPVPERPGPERPRPDRAGAGRPGPPRPRPPRPPAGRPVPRPGTGLSAASVPKILLALGAACLVVAALFFLAVAWVILGVGGRTVVLVLLTLVAGGLTLRTARSGLRGTTEALGAVTYGLLVVDLFGARSAGWLGAVTAPGFSIATGVLLLASGLAGALAVRSVARSGTRSGAPLITGEIAAALGLAAIGTGLGGGDRLSPSVAAVLVIALAAVVAAAAHLLGLKVLPPLALAVAATGWLWLSGYGFAELAQHAQTWRELWGEGHVWPLLVAAAIAAATAAVRVLPAHARTAAGAVAHPMFALSLLAPAAEFDGTTVTLIAGAVLLGCVATAWVLPRAWSPVPSITGTVAALVVAIPTVRLVVEAVASIVRIAAPPWEGAAGDLVDAPAIDDYAGGWLLPVSALALLLAAAVAGRMLTVALSGGRTPPPAWTTGRVVVATVAGTLLLIGTLALYPVPVALLLGLALLAATCYVAAWTTRRHDALLAAATGAGTLAALIGAHAEPLTLLVAVLVLGLAALVQLSARTETAAVLAGLLTGLLLGVVPALTADLLGARVEASALLGLVPPGVLVLLLGFLPAGWWAGRAVDARTGMEIGAAAAMATSTVIGSVLADDPAVWAAVYLTLDGVLVSAMALLRPDRRAVGWAGGALLATASWVRLWDLGVGVPEAYTLPSAVALLLVGVVRLQREPSLPTTTALSAGLGLALGPSLLLVWDEPTGLRTLLLGLGCLSALLVGIGMRWSAPVVAGGAAGAVLLLRLVGPVVAAVIPGWLVIGLAGALLVALGATWERRVAEARRLSAVIARLR